MKASSSGSFILSYSRRKTSKHASASVAFICILMGAILFFQPQALAQDSCSAGCDGDAPCPNAVCNAASGQWDTSACDSCSSDSDCDNSSAGDNCMCGGTCGTLQSDRREEIS